MRHTTQIISAAIQPALTGEEQKAGGPAPRHTPTISPCFVWHGDSAAASAAVDWGVFHLDVELNSVATEASMHLFAATRYRLRINDDIVAYGPARYVPGYEEYDTHCIAALLRPGVNRITVEACFINTKNYQAMPEAGGRFVAWGRIVCRDGQTHDLATPGAWRSQRCHARSQQAPAYSFAIGPVEVLDLRRLPKAEDTPGADATVAVGAEADVEELSPRSVGMANPPQVLTPRLLWGGGLADEEAYIEFVSVAPRTWADNPAVGRHWRFRYAMFILSPIEQSVDAGVHWGPHFLNGEEVDAADDPTRGNRQNAVLHLRAGWNLLCGEPHQLQAAYPMLIALPKKAGLLVRSRPDAGDPFLFRYIGAEAIAPQHRWSVCPPATEADLAATQPWEFAAAHQARACPARVMSWDRLAGQRNTSVKLPFTLPGDAGAWTAIFDFEEEYLGHVIVDIEAPSGSIVDLAYDERLREDGTIAFFQCNPFVESADRFVCRAGRQRIETFHPRGGRYLQVTVRRPAGNLPPAVLHGVSLRSGRCPPRWSGDFECDDALMNWTWKTGLSTLKASIEDSFCDTPWRERGSYLADSYVQSLILLVASDDHRLARRCLRLWAQGQLENGQMRCCVPAWPQPMLADFTLIYPIWLHDYWGRTGDLQTVEYCMPALQRIWACSLWTASRSLLWDARPEHNLYVDWAAEPEAKVCDESGVLNALRVRGLEATASLYEAMNDSGRAGRLRDEAGEVRRVYRQRLWMDQCRRFAGGTRDGQPIETDIAHANVLALAYGLADQHQEPHLAEHVIRRLRANPQHATGPRPTGCLELFYLKFALDALVRINRHDVAEEVIRLHYGIMRQRGAWTFWETLHRGVRGCDSLCHAWAADPMEYISRYVLGVREKTPGDPDRLIVDPRVASINHARGIVPHPAGPIHVRWTRQADGQLEICADAPAEVTLEIVTRSHP